MEYHHDEKCHEMFFNTFIKFSFIIPISQARTRFTHARSDACVHTCKRLDRQLSGTSCSRLQANIQLRWKLRTEILLIPSGSVVITRFTVITRLTIISPVNEVYFEPQICCSIPLARDYKAGKFRLISRRNALSALIAS